MLSHSVKNGLPLPSIQVLTCHDYARHGPSVRMPALKHNVVIVRIDDLSHLALASRRVQARDASAPNAGGIDSARGWEPRIAGRRSLEAQTTSFDLLSGH